MLRVDLLPSTPSWRGDVLAATLAAGERAVCSHATAAALLGLERVAAREPIEICVTGSAPPLLATVTVHRTRSLERCDVTAVDGIRVTTAARTLIDLAARLDRTQLLASMDDAICARLTSRPWLHRRASALQAGRHGVARLARLTDEGAEGCSAAGRSDGRVSCRLRRACLNRGGTSRSSPPAVGATSWTRSSPAGSSPS